MTFTGALEVVLTQLDELLDADGWDHPARLLELHLEPTGGAVVLTAAELVRLDAHAVCDLLRLRPSISPEAVGAVLVGEGWSYSEANMARLQAGEALTFPPSEDPNRVEFRYASLCLRDGTEATLHHPRGGTAELLPAMDSRGWLPQLLRNAVGCENPWPPLGQPFALRVALHWQAMVTTALVNFAAAGRAVPAPAFTYWGQLDLPGVEAVEELRRPWWEPVEAVLAGAPFDGPALARALRADLAPGVLSLPFVFPYQRQGTTVPMTPELAAWCDDPTLLMFLDHVTPPVARIAERLERSLGPDWAASFRTFCQGHPELA